jgi:very-short-patch-repair endonuclease
MFLRSTNGEVAGRRRDGGDSLPRKKHERNVKLARKLRDEMSLPEVLLWQALRKASDGVKIRRQHPLGPYVLDFYCAEAKIAVEIDGIAHDMGDRPALDEVRERWLCDQDIEVMRIPAAEVLRSVSDTAEAIVRYCKR